MRQSPFLKPMFWLVFVALALAVIEPAYADNILDTVGQTYKDATGGWESNLVPIAKGLFVKLALIELLWSAIWWLIEKNDPNEILVALIKKIMPLMFFYAILLNFDTWIPSVIASFSQAGQTASGTTALTPSSVLDRGLEIATSITTAVNEKGFFSTAANPGPSIMAGLAALGILLSFGVIAGQMLVTLIESYIVVSGGVLFLGFAGSRWTTTFAEKYLSYAVSVGVKLFVTYLIIGAGSHLSDTWAANIAKDMTVADYMTVLVGSMVYMFLAWQIPSLASSMLTGAVSMTLGSAAATMGTMAAGAAGAVGLAKAGASTGASSVAGAAQAGSAAINQAKAGGASGFAGIAAGAAGALASAGAGKIADGIKGLGSSSTGGSLAGRMNEKAASLKEAAAAGSPAASVPGGQPAAPAPAAESKPAASETPSPNAATTPAAEAAAPAAGTAGTESAAPTPPAPADAGGASVPPADTAAPAPAAPPDAGGAAAPAAPAPAASTSDAAAGGTSAPAGSSASNDTPAPAAPAPEAQATPAPDSSAQPAAPTTSPAAAPLASSPAPAPAQAAPAQTPSNPQASSGAGPAAPSAPEQGALEKLMNKGGSLAPNDSAASAGVQIQLKHD